MEEGVITRVLNDFMTVADGELNLKKGDIVQVLTVIDRHWCFGCCGSKYGNVPSSYLILLDAPLLDDDQELFAATANFIGQEPGDLGFARGELIVGLGQINANWWHGKIDERLGIFPVTYTWQLESKYFKNKPTCQTLNKTARVKMNMKAQLDEEIDLFAGEIVTLLSIVDKNWYKGTCGGRTGIFPSAYVEVLEDENTTGEEVRTPSSASSSHAMVADNFSFEHQQPYRSSRILSNDVDDMLSISPEKQVEWTDHTSYLTSADHSDDLSIFDDDYFKVNMPSLSMREEASGKISEFQTPVELDIVPYGITLYPFYAQFDNELSFHEGEIVTLIRHIDKDWIEGQIDNKKGIFPVSYVNILVDCEDQSTVPVSDCNDNQTTHLVCYLSSFEPDTVAKVLYNFDAQMNSDLTVKEGELVLVVKQVEDDWCEVKNMLGNCGLCPRNYLTAYVENEMDHRHSLPTDSSGVPILGPEDGSQTNALELNKRKYESHDFYKSSLGSAQDSQSIEDLISKNLKTLEVLKPTTEDKSHNVCRSSVFDGTEFKEKMPMTVLEREEESGSLTESVEDTRFASHGLADNRQDLPAKDAVQEDTFTDTSAVKLRRKPSPVERKPSRPCPPVPETTMQSSDRESMDFVPHRPAPPVPVPGQKPVRRSLRRAPHPILHSQDSTAVVEEQFISEEQMQKVQPDSYNTVEATASLQQEHRKKNMEQRQNVISELVITEKEYVKDLKITYETFNLYNPDYLESRGVDVKMLFGNILEVLHVAEQLQDSLLLAMKGKSDDEQLVGPSFLQHADQMKAVYGEYCMNHDGALALLEKYETNPTIKAVLGKGVETLRYQIACFDMGSILIKPVQRILKYPLILNELIKCTEDGHADKCELLKAVRTMMDVASYINEHKRRKDIVSKYLEDGNSTMSRKMAKLNLHSVAKKSTRIGVKLSSSLGITPGTKDPVFDEHEAMFHAVEKMVRSFLRGTENVVMCMQEVFSSQYSIAEAITQFHKKKNQDEEKFQAVQRRICTQFWEEFKKTVDRRVTTPLNVLLELFEGPAILVQKRHDKLLDYDGCSAKAEKNKENRLIQEELSVTRNNYEALNSHLVEELPELIKFACDLFIECVAAFVTARKLLSGKITKQYLFLLELPFMESTQGDPIEVFAVKHTLMANQFTRFSFSSKSLGKGEPAVKKTNKSPVPSTKQTVCDVENKTLSQSPSQQAYLRSRYPLDSLYRVKVTHAPSESLELSADRGCIVGVIKKQDPMGNTSMWFVDNGGSKGFLPCHILEILPVPNSEERTHINSTNRSSCTEAIGQPFLNSSIQSSKTTKSTLQTPPPKYEEVVADLDDDYQHIGGDSQAHLYEEIQDQPFYYAMYKFSGQGDPTLTLACGQTIKVLQRHDEEGNNEWWLVETREGNKGYVPGNFLKKIE